MSKQSALMGVGFSAEQAKAICGLGAQGLVATGSSSSDALNISSHLNAFSTVAASTGAILSTAFQVGDDCYVYNGGASTLAVYPPAGATVDNTTSVNVTTKKGVWLKLSATNVWLSHGST